MIHEKDQQSQDEKLRLYLHRRRGDSVKNIENIRLNWACLIDANPEEVEKFLGSRSPTWLKHWLGGIFP